MNKIVKFLSLGIKYTNSVLYRRVILISSLSIIATIILIFFTILDAFKLNNYNLAIADLTASIISFIIILHLKRYKNVSLSAKVATLNLMVFLLLLAYFNGNSHFSLIWTIFLPIFAILANGKKVGLYFSVVFYAVLLPFAYINIDVWSNGTWLIQDWIRLMTSSLILTFIMYMNEKALEESNKKLEDTRALEKIYIQELHEKSITDQLTNLYNRRYYNEVVPKLMNIAKRKAHYITFFILDIDFFKDYNDFYGHIKGDEALVKISIVIKQHIQRGDDFVFRLGGEEFAGVVISDNYEKTHLWIEEICTLIEALKIKHSKSKVSTYITTSVGIATVCHDSNCDIDKLYSLADKALYCAKHNGRNRSELSLECA